MLPLFILLILVFVFSIKTTITTITTKTKTKTVLMMIQNFQCQFFDTVLSSQITIGEWFLLVTN